MSLSPLPGDSVDEAPCIEPQHDATASVEPVTAPMEACGAEMPVDASDLPSDTEPATQPESQYEVIAGFRVHPLASRFPLVTGQQFEEMVEAIARSRTIPPVEFNSGLLIDGRNRVRAVEEVRRRGIEIDLPTVEWYPTENETLEEHIYAANICRRHLTVDQRAALSTVFLPAIRESRRRRQVATRFGGPRATVTQDSASPSGEPSEGLPDGNGATSTRGQLARLASISRYKAEQALALADGVANGSLSDNDVRDVTTGEKSLSDVLKKTPGRRKTSGTTRRRPSNPDELPDDSVLTEEAVLRRFEKWMQGYAVTDHRDVRQWVAKKIASDQREFDR